VHVLPENVDFEQAAALANYQVALALLQTAGPRVPRTSSLAPPARVGSALGASLPSLPA
jgi:hypothetical protein